MRQARLEKLGIVPYGPMLALQEARHAEVVSGACDDTLFLLEHEPVVTTGRNYGDENILMPQSDLAASGIELFHTGRGGDVTFHGPGQLVGYPIFHLEEHERDVRKYVTHLEAVLINTAADFGIDACRIPGLRGIWVGESKLAAIGVRLSRWTTMHGFALNIDTDLGGFDTIVPCGLQGKGVTSLATLLGRAPARAEVEACVVRHMTDLFGRTFCDVTATPVGDERPAVEEVVAVAPAAMGRR